MRPAGDGLRIDRSPLPSLAFEAGAPPLFLQPALPGARGRGGGLPLARGDGRAADEIGEALDGVFAVLLLGTESARLNHENPLFGEAVSRELPQTTPDRLGQGTGALEVETELDGGGGFVDVLPARSARPDEFQLDLAGGNLDVVIDRDRQHEGPNGSSIIPPFGENACEIAMSELVIGGIRVPAGSRKLVCLPVTRDVAMPIDIHTHVVAGKNEGPTLLLLSMLHGNEWFSVLILRELLSRLDPSELSGNVLAVPVANAAAFATGTRVIVDDSDEPDCNRTFGGIYDWMTNQITRVIERELFTRCTHLIDYHVSDWGSTMADVSYTEDFTDREVSERSREMALAFGFPVIHALRIRTGLRGPRTSVGFAGERYRIAGMVAEVGGLGFGESQERVWLERNVRGTMGVMRHLGMIAGAPEREKRVLRISDYWRVSPRVGGYLEPVIGLDRQFTEIQNDELMARIVSPFTLDIVDELRSPGRGTLFYTCRSYMARPGAWAFGVADMEKSEWLDLDGD
jgi:uncharacterized protein